MSGILHGTVIVSFFNILGLIFRIFTVSTMAQFFGAGPELDAYFVGITLPTVVLGMISNAFANTIIPVLSDQFSSIDEIEKTTIKLFQWSFIISFFFVLIFILLAKTIIAWIAPGLHGDYFELAITIFKISSLGLLPALPLEVLTSFYILQSKFFLTSFIKFIQPVVLLIGTVILSGRFGTMSLAFSQVLGIFLGLLILMSYYCRKKFRVFFIPLNLDPSIIKIGKLILPLFVGMLTYRTLPVFDRWVASQMEAGKISLVNYAQKIMETFQILLFSGLSTAIFPSLAQNASTGNIDSTNQILEKAIRLSLFIYFPACFILYFSGDSLITLLLEHGKFSNLHGYETFKILKVYIYVLPALAICAIIGQGYYIKKDTQTVAIIGVVEALVYVSAAFLFRGAFGILCLPLAYICMFWFAVLIDGSILEKKHSFKLFCPIAKGIFISFSSCSIAALPWYIQYFVIVKHPLIYLDVICLFFFTILYFFIHKNLFHSNEIYWFKNISYTILSKLSRRIS